MSDRKLDADEQAVLDASTMEDPTFVVTRESDGSTSVRVEESPRVGRADYAERQEARRERLENAADKARAESERRLATARSISSGIPFGQPILVGHHSEKRHRRDIEKIHTNYRKGFEATERADKLDKLAEGIGTRGISSDDPEAVVKLRAELEEKRREHEMEKAANKAWKRYGRMTHDDAGTVTEGGAMLLAALRAIGFTDNQIKRQMHTMSVCRHIDAPFHLGNNTANLRRIEKRIEELLAKAKRVEAHEAGEAPIMEPITGTVAGTNVTFEIQVRADINRIALTFSGRIGKDLFGQIKRMGWRWSPTEEAFLTGLHNSGVWHAKDAARVLSGTTTEPAAARCAHCKAVLPQHEPGCTVAADEREREAT